MHYDQCNNITNIMKTNALWLTAGIDLGLLANLKLTKTVIGIFKA